MSPIRRTGSLVLALVLALSCVPSVHAQERAIDDIRIQTDGDRAVITIQFACDMRFVADTPTSGGALLEVRVAPFDSCLQRGIGSSIVSESYVPIGAESAYLESVEYDSLGLGDSIVSLTFNRPVDYSVTQRPSLREVEISVDLTTQPARRPLSVRVVEPTATRDYMINLQSTREPVDDDVLESIPVDADHWVYVSDIRVDGVLWHRLRIGFYASETEAKAALESLAASFPRAWVGRAEPREIELAAGQGSAGGTRRLPTLASEQPEPAASGAPTATLDAGEIASMMSEARAALLEGDNETAIRLYSTLVQTAGEHRPEAMEFLGLAYERSEQPGRARAQYQQYLREFPDNPARTRVEQRLNSIVASAESPREALRDTSAASGPAWDFSAGVSQYYRRDDNQFDEDQPNETTQSALLTDLDFSLNRSGERFDVLSRVSLSHYSDLLSEAEGGRGDQDRLSYAYVEIAEAGQQWDLRLGRQSLHTFGVLGRFDGAHFGYGIGEDKRLHVMLGYPVESTRDSLQTDRQFAGVAIELDDLVGSWDISAFVNSQTIDGIDARLAIGTEARYFDQRRSVTAMFDYDLDFADVNMVLVLGTWRLANRVMLSALVDHRKSPILSTRNALIGQPVETIDEMLLVWTEEEVRSLALDRTAESKTTTLGIATPLGERLQLNFDVTTSEIGATVGSGGVSAIPGTGVQTFYSASLVSTGLFASSAVNIWNLRVGDADAYASKLLTWDGRFPVGRHLRINPRIRLALWQGLADGRERRTISPSLRLLLNAKNRYRLEFEIGRDEVTRTVAGTESIASSRFVNLGYRASF